MSELGNDDRRDNNSWENLLEIPGHPLKGFLKNDPKVDVDAFSHERIVTLNYAGPQKLLRFAEAMIDAIQPQYDMQRGYIRVKVGDYPSTELKTTPWESHGFPSESSYHLALDDLITEQNILFTQMNKSELKRDVVKREFARVSKEINSLGGVQERRNSGKPPVTYSPELDSIIICPAEFSAFSLDEKKYERKVWDYFTTLFRSALAVHEFGDLNFYQVLRANYEKMDSTRRKLGELFDLKSNEPKNSDIYRELLTTFPDLRNKDLTQIKPVEESLLFDLQIRNWRMMEKLEALHITQYIDLLARHYAGGSVWARQRTLFPDITEREESHLKTALSRIAYDRGRLGTYTMFQNAKDLIQSAYYTDTDVLELITK